MYDGVEAGQPPKGPQKSTKPFKGETDPKKAIVYSPRTNNFPPVSVADIWTRLEHGQSRSQIKKELNPIKSHHIDIAESFMMENHRPIYSSLMVEPQSPYRVWIDECVKWSHGSALHKMGFGKVRSVVQSNKSGTKDPHLWRFLIRKQADLVITRDGRDVTHKSDTLGMKLTKLNTQHLTTLAQKSREPNLCSEWHNGHPITGKKFPFILIIDNDVSDNELQGLLRKYRSNILRCVKRKKINVYARLGHNGLHSIRTVENIKISTLEPLATKALKEIEDLEGLPFASPRIEFNQVISMKPEKALALEKEKAVALEVYKEHRNELKDAIIAFAKAKNMLVDIDLARHVIYLLYSDDDTARQAAQSPQQVSYQDHSTRLRHASLG